jgi:hypothetical protein
LRKAVIRLRSDKAKGLFGWLAKLLEGRVKEVRKLAVGYVRYMGSERRSTSISTNLTGGRFNVGRMELLDLPLEKLWVGCERARLQGGET